MGSIRQVDTREVNDVRVIIRKENSFALQTSTGYRIKSWTMRWEETDEHSCFDATLLKIGDIFVFEEFDNK